METRIYFLNYNSKPIFYIHICVYTLNYNSKTWIFAFILLITIEKQLLDLNYNSFQDDPPTPPMTVKISLFLGATVTIVNKLAAQDMYCN